MQVANESDLFIKPKTDIGTKSETRRRYTEYRFMRAVFAISLSVVCGLAFYSVYLSFYVDEKMETFPVGQEGFQVRPLDPSKPLKIFSEGCDVTWSAPYGRGMW